MDKKTIGKKMPLSRSDTKRVMKPGKHNFYAGAQKPFQVGKELFKDSWQKVGFYEDAKGKITVRPLGAKKAK